MAEPSACEMVIADLNYEFGLEGLPLGGPFRGPTAWSTRSPAGKPGRLAESHKFTGKLRFFGGFQPGAEPDVMQQTRVIIKPE